MSAHLQNRWTARRRARSRAPTSAALDKRHLVTLALALALLAAALLFMSRTAAAAQIAVRVESAPPPLPVYQQPPLPAPGYLWVPGYWSWGPQGYFWVPGTWALPPDPDLVWTPGYWGYADDAYLWNPGYWGPEVGFYGGVAYGFGYFGHGFDGGYWRDHQFWYNRAVNNLGSTHVTNVYNRTVNNNVTVNNVSYNGGPGGINARPTEQEQAASRKPRHAATRDQVAHATTASENRELLASVNQGRPPIAATPTPDAYSGQGVVPARNSPAQHLAQAPPQSAPPPTHEHPGPAERGTPPAQTHAAPEIGPNERSQVERPPPPAAPPPPERAPPQGQPHRSTTPDGHAPDSRDDRPPH